MQLCILLFLGLLLHDEVEFLFPHALDDVDFAIIAEDVLLEGLQLDHESGVWRSDGPHLPHHLQSVFQGYLLDFDHVTQRKAGGPGFACEAVN